VKRREPHETNNRRKGAAQKNRRRAVCQSRSLARKQGPAISPCRPDAATSSFNGGTRIPAIRTALRETVLALDRVEAKALAGITSRSRIGANPNRTNKSEKQHHAKHAPGKRPIEQLWFPHRSLSLAPIFVLRPPTAYSWQKLAIPAEPKNHQQEADNYDQPGVEDFLLGSGRTTMCPSLLGETTIELIPFHDARQLPVARSWLRPYIPSRNAVAAFEGVTAF